MNEMDIDILQVKDMVYNPTHYQSEEGKDCWTAMSEEFGTDATIIFDCLNAFKYNWRAGKKDGNSKEQDLAKRDNYISHAKSLVDKTLEEEDLKPLEPEDEYAVMIFRKISRELK